VLRGDTFGQWHAELSVIFVSEHTVAVDDGGIVIRGIGKYSGGIGRPNFDPKTMTLSWAAENSEGHPANDPGRRDPWIDISDDQIVFELSAPRVASQKVTTAVAAIGNTAGFADAAAVLNAYDGSIVDDVWCLSGATNFRRRGMTFDGSVAIAYNASRGRSLSPAPPPVFGSSSGPCRLSPSKGSQRHRGRPGASR
jgi:hypothetical protein